MIFASVLRFHSQSVLWFHSQTGVEWGHWTGLRTSVWGHGLKTRLNTRDGILYKSLGPRQK